MKKCICLVLSLLLAIAMGVPVWAADAIFSLNAVGILTSTNGCIDPGSEMTRGQTAQILAAMMAYRES